MICRPAGGPGVGMSSDGFRSGKISDSVLEPARETIKSAAA